jgi:hypothetical protein
MSLPGNIKDREFEKFREVSDGTAVAFVPAAGIDINPLAKYVEAEYEEQNAVVVYKYYEASAKVTLLTTIRVRYSEPQDTSFVSAEWS